MRSSELHEGDEEGQRAGLTDTGYDVIADLGMVEVGCYGGVANCYDEEEAECYEEWGFKIFVFGCVETR